MYIIASFEFKPYTTLRHPNRILNIVPGDFTHSGKLDLLIMAQSDTVFGGGQELEMVLYPASVDGGFGRPLRSFFPFQVTH
jgi:integrin alpha FG-GAP repeat containing protein 1